MTTIRDWQHNRAMRERLLERQTNQKLDYWNQLIRETQIEDENDLRTWLADRGVTGYARALLVMERFGYPDFLTATADELIARQYANRPNLRAIYEAVIKAGEACGEIIIQAQRNHVSLLAPRRIFARIQPARNRVDLGLRLEQCEPLGRIELSRLHHTMRIQIGLLCLGNVDAEVQQLMAEAYQENS